MTGAVQTPACAAPITQAKEYRVDHVDAAREVCQRIAADSRRPEAERRLAAVGAAALQEDVLPPTTSELLSHIIDSLVAIENRVTRIELTLVRHNIRPIA